MLERVQVSNFQSIRKLDIELGRFTVIVGPSSSGKSAFMRAMRVLSSNARGSSFITHGESSCSIAARNEHGLVELRRSKGGGEYHVTLHDGATKSFTKLAGGVPDEVTSVLGLKPARDGQSISFSSQFDRPYLLDDTGQQVARTLGELTNVTVLLNASREGSRRKQEANGVLKTRQQDVLDRRNDLQGYASIRDELTSVEAAEALLTEAEKVDAKLERCTSLLDRITVAEAATQLAIPPDPPDYEPIKVAHDRVSAFTNLLFRLKKAREQQRSAESELRRAELQLEDAHAAYEAAKEELDICPVCQQELR